MEVRYAECFEQVPEKMMTWHIVHKDVMVLPTLHARSRHETLLIPLPAQMPVKFLNNLFFAP